MPLTFDDNSAIDKFNRCKHQAVFLEKEVTNDGFIRFSDYAWCEPTAHRLVRKAALNSLDIGSPGLANRALEHERGLADLLRQAPG